MSKIKDTDYLYITTLIRAKEARLLTPEQAGRMIDARSDEEAVMVLEECGYDELTGLDTVALERHLSERQSGIFKELHGFCPEPLIVDIFRLKYDYHNVKILIKAQAVNTDGARLMSDNGRVDIKTLEEAYYQDSFARLTPVFGVAIQEARDTLARTKDPQLSDILLDKAYFRELLELTDKIDSEFLRGYIELSVDAVNLRTAVRASRMDIDSAMLPDIFIPGGKVSANSLAQTLRQAETLATLYTGSALGSAAAAGSDAISGDDLTLFEKLCDDALTKYLQDAKRVSFGEAPVIAYLYAMEAEIAAVRIIMNGRIGRLSSEKIRERLRDFYV